jgi:hypothetical protein
MEEPIGPIRFTAKFNFKKYFVLLLWAGRSGVLGFDSRLGLGILLFTTTSRTALGPTKPPIQWVPGVPSLGVKRPGREADHSPPSSAQYTFIAWCSVKKTGTNLLTCTIFSSETTHKRSSIVRDGTKIIFSTTLLKHRSFSEQVSSVLKLRYLIHGTEMVNSRLVCDPRNELSPC